MVVNLLSVLMMVKVLNKNAPKVFSITQHHDDVNAVCSFKSSIFPFQNKKIFFYIELGPLENLCVSQPCLNGGQCTPVDSSFQCQCAPGFDGKTCELDARACQTQQSCGQSPDARCQSFRLGAALQYICILQDGLAYGLTAQQGTYLFIRLNKKTN
jgi:hypothetical protein